MAEEKITIAKVFDVIYLIVKALEKIPQMWERFRDIQKANEFYSRQKIYEEMRKEAVAAYATGNTEAVLDAWEGLDE